MDFAPEVIAAVREVAPTQGIEARTLLAFIAQESAGRAEVTRYEALWKRFVDVTQWSKTTGISALTEYHEQAISWGLMQVMGSRARELGFRGLLPELVAPAAGIHWGALCLKDLARRFNLPRVPVISLSEELACAYNHGSPQRKPNGEWVVEDYVTSIFAHYQAVKGKI